MNNSSRLGSGLVLQLLMLTALGITYSQGEIIVISWYILFNLRQAGLSEEYLKDIKADQVAEQASGSYNYDQQGNDWEGTCQDGQQQSPVSLTSSGVGTQQTLEQVGKLTAHGILDRPL